MFALLKNDWLAIASMLLLNCFLCSSLAFSQQEDTDIEGAIRISHSIPLKIHTLMPFEFPASGLKLIEGHRGSVELGKLEPNQAYRLALQLENNTDNDFEFDQVKSNCACGSLSLKRMQNLKAGDKQTFDVFFRTPQVTKDGKHLFIFNFMKGKNHQGMVSFKATLLRNLYLAPNHVFEISLERKKIQIPIVFNEPIQHEDLRLDTVEELAELRPRIIKIDGRSLVEFELSAQQLKGDFLLGFFEVSSEKHEVIAKSELMLQRRGRVQISPEILRLRKEKEKGKEGGSISGNLIVRIMKSENADEQEQKRFTSEPSFFIDSGDVKFAIKSVKLNEDIFRLIVTADADQLDTLLELEEITLTTVFEGATTRKVILLSVSD